MLYRLLFIGLLGGLVSLAACNDDDDNVALSTQVSSNSYEIALIGDLPYREELDTWDRLIAEINTAELQFVMHIGDIKIGRTVCSDEHFQYIQNEFSKSVHPFFYTPGDNDWTDCNRTNNGGYDPHERLAQIRALFTQGDTSMGQNTLPLQRQSAITGFETFRENILWTHNNVQYGAVHVVGSRNNSTRQSQDTDTVWANRQVEYQARNAANLAWLDTIFSEAQDKAGLMLFIHANPGWEWRSESRTVGFTDFLARLETLTIAYGKPVMLVHGDSHYYRMDKPLLGSDSNRTLENFTRVEVYGYNDVHWLRVLVNPDDVDVFTVMTEHVSGNYHVANDSGRVRDCGFCTSNEAFDVALMGDLPYREPLETWDRLLADVNNSDVKFAVHVGDIKSGSTTCDDEYFQYIQDEFNKSKHPLFYTPGDNEWTDCLRDSNGGYDPHERLAKIRDLFTQGETSFGETKLDVTRQSRNAGFEIFRENQMWTYNDVMFSAIHVVGSNNNNTRQSQDTDEIWAARQAEYAERNAANLVWLEKTFTEAKALNSPGIMLLIHANPINADSWYENGRPASGFVDFIRQLLEETIAYGKPVVLVHGDSHYFRLDQPFISNGRRIENLIRAEVFGSRDVHWLRATVDPNHPEVFWFHPEVVDGNKIRH